jgi:hypothetical protein
LRKIKEVFAMALAAFAAAAIPLPGIPIFCHTATWYWAGQEAALRAPSLAQTPVQRIGNIAGMPNGPQNEMLALQPLSSPWNFVNGLPPAGTVLLWTAPPTHSAVVTAGGISGYNQGCVTLAAIGIGLTTLLVAQLAANKLNCSTIAESDIVLRAIALGI